jgi:hypothetical protein
MAVMCAIGTADASCFCTATTTGVAVSLLGRDVDDDDDVAVPNTADIGVDDEAADDDAEDAVVVVVRVKVVVVVVVVVDATIGCMADAALAVTGRSFDDTKGFNGVPIVGVDVNKGVIWDCLSLIQSCRPHKFTCSCLPYASQQCR